MKHYTLLFFSLISCSYFSQSLFVKSESVTEGVPSIMAKLTKSSAKAYYKDNRVKTETKVMNFTQTQITEVDKVTILNSAESNCAVITKDELKVDSLENDLFISDLTIENTNETKKILGYECKKIRISYKSSNADNTTIKVQSELIYWITSDLTLPNSDKLPMETTKRNALIVAMQSIKGMVLQTEAKMNGINVVMTVIEISTKEINDSVFEINSKSCKTPMNLSEYKKYLLKKKRQSQLQGFGY